MSDYPGTGRLEPELLAAYIDGELPPEARAKVEAEIAADPENYEWLVNVMTAVDAESIPGGEAKAAGQGQVRNEVQVDPEPLPTPVPEPQPIRGGGGTKKDQKIIPFYRRRSVVGAIGALAVAASVMLVVQTEPDWYSLMRRPHVDGGLAALVEAVGEERYLEARLTGGFKYGPLRQVMRGPNDLSKQNLQLLAAAGAVQEAAENTPSPINLHTWGVAQLLLGDLDGAVETLGIAVRLEPDSAALHADLGAALLTRFERNQSDEDLPAAADSFQHALSISPALPEARFGNALSLERLGFKEAAREAWASYLETDSSSLWADDARLHLERIETKEPEAKDLRGLLGRYSLDQAIGPDAQTVREAVEDSLIVAWADEAATSTQVPSVAALRELIHEVARSQQDYTLLDTFEPVASSPKSERSSTILAAFRCHGQMRKAYLAFDTIAQLRLSERCLELFRQASVPFQYWSAIYRARALQAVSRIPESQSLTDATLIQTSSQRYSLVHAWALLQRGALAYRAGSAAEAIGPLSQARALFADRGEVERAAGAADILAAVYRNAGDTRRQWRSVRQAQSSQPSRPSTIRWHATRISAVNYAVESGYSYLADRVLQTVLAAAEHSGIAGRIADSALQLARISAERGHGAVAGQQAQRAIAAAGQISDTLLRRQFEAALALFDAEYVSGIEPHRAGAAVRLARRYLSSVDDYTRTLALFRLELRGAIASGEVGEADALVSEGVAAARTQAAAFASTGERVKFIATFREFSALAAAHYVETGRPQQALQLLEASSQTTGIAVSDYSQLIVPEDEAIFVLRVADREIWRWCITSRATIFSKIPLPSTSVGRALAELRATLQGEGGLNDSSVLESIFEGLAADVLRSRRWVFVLRDFPASFPVAALRTGNGLTVADQHECVFASSVIAYLSRAASLVKSSAPTRALIVAGPTGSTFETPRLVSGEREGLAVAKIYGTTVVPGHTATVEEFERSMNQADVVHFVGHAAASRRGALDSYLVLEPSPAYPLGLFTGEMATSRQFTTKTLVLASCSSAEPSPGFGGVETLAAAFSAAGVRQVVGTLWAVADDEAQGAFVALHELIRAGIDVPEAVRQVQVRFRDERRPGRIWASLAVVVA